ncbi:MAG: SRPBCC family protein [Acidimicrobiales bacterium]
MDRRTETQSIESDAGPEAVVALLAQPSLIPEWAPAFADAVIGEERPGWRAIKDGREFDVRVVVNRDTRTVDYLREVAPGREGGAYIRVVPRPGGGSVVIMTLPLVAGVDPADTSATLRDELNALARLAEGS